jgi:hypothetical protein
MPTVAIVEGVKIQFYARGYPPAHFHAIFAEHRAKMSDDLPRPPGMPPLEELGGEPEWDQDEADWLIGKYVLVGITRVASDGKTVKSQDQFHGRVTKAERNVGITIACEGAAAGRDVVVPPDLRSFQLARPGRYTLRSNREVIDDPDFTTSWTITESAKS